MFHYYIHFFFICFGVLASCCKKSSFYQDTMKRADGNRAELDGVLYHYREVDPNPEKLSAAKYLIKNLAAHYSYMGNEIQDYYDYAALILKDTSLKPEQQRDSLLEKTDLKYSSLADKTIYDAQIIKAKYLIDNIDKSYNAWKNYPWANHLSFDDYLEWLLPYKGVELQELDSWRDTLYSHFGEKMNSQFKNDVEYETTVGMAEKIRNNIFQNIGRYGLYTRSGLPLLNSYLLPRQTFGDIQDYALLAHLSFRASGIPSVIDETPVGARDIAASRWFVILSDRGQELASEWDVSTLIGGSFFPYERGPKVYRRTYEINSERKKYYNNAKWIYPFDLFHKDVTSQYYLDSDVYLNLKKCTRSKLKDKYVYIASAIRINQESQAVIAGLPDYPGWKIVDFGVIKGKKALFKNMGREVLYLALGYDGNSLIPLDNPFILHKDGSLEFILYDTVKSTSLDMWKNNDNTIRP